MKKYLAIIKTESQRIFTYRLSMIGYRIGNLFEILIQTIVWSVAFSAVDVIGGYNYSEMISYVIIGNFFNLIISNYGFESEISEQIETGELSNILVKPISYLNFVTVKVIARTVVALTSSFLMFLVLVFVFFDKLVFPTNPLIYLLLVFMILIGYFIKLFFSLLIGFGSFWLTKTNGLQASASVIIKFFSGGYFPITMLPLSLVYLSSFFPFIYLYFMPLQLYLGKISLLKAFNGLMVETAWLIILYIIVKITWKFGLKKYEAVGI